MTHYVLVDFENVQPKNLGALHAAAFHIKVFVGASQSKITLELAQALQAFGDAAEYVQVSGNGSNALDFHIAYEIGRLVAAHRGARFTIVSKDTGFDPLLRHLAGQGVSCSRVKAIGEIAGAKAVDAPRRTAAVPPEPADESVVDAVPGPKPRTRRGSRGTKKAAVVPPSADYGKVIARLVNLKTARPATLKKLRSSMLSWFKPALSADDVDALLAELSARGALTVSGNKVTYEL